MHIPDGMLSNATVAATGVASLGYVGYGVAWVRKHFDQRKVVLMAVTAALIFALQMLNFPVAAGTSGHFAGGALAAILLGPFAAGIVMTTVLLIQAVVFADGGILALGANVFNLAVVAPLVGWGTWRLFLRFGDSQGAQGRGRVRGIVGLSRGCISLRRARDLDLRQRPDPRRSRSHGLLACDSSGSAKASSPPASLHTYSRYDPTCSRSPRPRASAASATSRSASPSFAHHRRRHLVPGLKQPRRTRVRLLRAGRRRRVRGDGASLEPDARLRRSRAVQRDARRHPRWRRRRDHHRCPAVCVFACSCPQQRTPTRARWPTIRQTEGATTRARGPRRASRAR